MKEKYKNEKLSVIAELATKAVQRFNDTRINSFAIFGSVLI